MPISSDYEICNMALVYAGAGVRIGSLDDRSAAAQHCKTFYDQKRREVLSAFRWRFSVRRALLTPYSADDWSATETYAEGDLASVGVNVYRSLQAGNLNKEPDLLSSTAWWAQVTRDGWSYVCLLPADLLEPMNVYERPAVSANSGTRFDFSQVDLRTLRSAQREAYSIEDANDGTGQKVFLTDLDTPMLVYQADITNPLSMDTMFIESLAWCLAVPLNLALRADASKSELAQKMYMQKIGEAFSIHMRDEQQEDPEPVSEFEAAREG